MNTFEIKIALQLDQKRVSFFLCFGVIGLLAAIGGFATTFIYPMYRGTFQAPPAVHIHGAFAFGWIILFLCQTLLIHFRNYRTHIFLGSLGLVIAVGTAVTMVPAGMYVVERSLTKGGGEGSYSSIVGIVTAAILFLGLVAAGFAKRRNAAVHKRLMLLATIFVLWPAWFRFRHYFPSVPRPDIWFGFILADSFIVIAWVWDKWRNGRVNKTLLYTGLLIIVENALEIAAFDSGPWRMVGKKIYAMLS